MKKYPSGKNIKHTPAPGKKELHPLKTLPEKDPTVYYAVIAIIFACFILYGNTLTLKYAYDDLMVITGNQFTKQGFHGIGNIFTTDYFTGFFGKDQNMVSGGRYRPLSLVMFAVEYQLFGENPVIGHLMNVILFSLICVSLLFLLRKLSISAGFLHDKPAWYFSAPFLICLLYAAHPVHTEVVANIKSRDELLAFLFCLLTLWFSLKFLDERKIYLFLLSGLTFFLALLSKENSATFLLILPVTVFFFTRTSIKNNLVALIPLATATFIFLVIRGAVVGHFSTQLANDLMNNPFVEMTQLQKYATILYTLGLYVKLLIFPHPLTCDYYPYHIPIINPGDWRAILSLVIYLAMIIYIFVKMRKKDLIAYCFLFFLVTLSVASNIVFPIGAFMNERFLFMPSLGYCILLGVGFIRLSKKIPGNTGARASLLAALMVVTLSLYGWKTVTRNLAWYDSYTLFTTDVKVSANSAKSNEVAGEYILQKATGVKDKVAKDSMLRLSIAYQRKAISVYPKQIIALINLAAAYYEYNRNYDTILVVYKTILNFLPGSQHIYTYFNSIMGKYDNVDHKIRLYSDLRKLDTERWDMNINLGILWLTGKNNPGTALPFLQKAAAVNPGDFDSQKFLGLCYGYLGNWKDAATHLELAENIKPGEAELNKNLSIIYANLGEHDKAQAARERSAKGQQK